MEVSVTPGSPLARAVLTGGAIEVTDGAAKSIVVIGGSEIALACGGGAMEVTDGLYSTVESGPMVVDGSDGIG
jgi:hypothetical protein